MKILVFKLNPDQKTGVKLYCKPFLSLRKDFHKLHQSQLKRCKNCFQVVSERTKPRVRHFLSEVFLIIGGCTKDELFISSVTCLDPLRRSRLDVARLPITEMEDESLNRKWVEFACVTFCNEVYISGERHFTLSNASQLPSRSVESGKCCLLT